MPYPFRCSLPLLLLLAVLPACDNQDMQEDFAARAFGPPANITRTDASGNILEEDPDDWQTAPAFPPQAIRVDQPASPNPSSGEVSIILTMFPDIIFGRLFLRVRTDAGDFNTVQIIEDAGRGGQEIFQFNANSLGREGLHRLVITDQTGEVVTYGDLQVE